MNHASMLFMLLLMLVIGCIRPDHSVENSASQECTENTQAIAIELVEDPVQVAIAQGLWRVDVGVLILGCSATKEETVIQGFRGRVRKVLSQQEDLIFPLVFEANRDDPEIHGKILEVVKGSLPELSNVSMELTVETIQDHNMAEFPVAKESSATKE